MPDFIEGELLLIDKALNWTSFDVVKKVRYLLLRHLHMKKLKVGHAGTLDPLATGLLILCTGKMTKQIDSIQAQQKEYTGTIRLGASTPSADLETSIDQHYPTEHLSEALIKEAAKKFTGQIKQYPPIFSAKKIEGKRAYDYAREGKEVQMRPNMVDVEVFEILKVDMPELHFRIVCSKGTYIRSLARDLGRELKSGGHLTALRRTAIGNYRIEDAQSVEAFEKGL